MLGISVVLIWQTIGESMVLDYMKCSMQCNLVFSSTVVTFSLTLLAKMQQLPIKSTVWPKSMANSLPISPKGCSPQQTFPSK
jgi:hypothetical protein